ncbi:MAG: MFS transporter [Anaerolineaceae bacterium]|nr:MFS transporter [Anaerolineaceae bacterium]
MQGTQKIRLSNRFLFFLGGMILANIPDAMFRGIFALYLMELVADIGEVGLYFTLGMIAPLLFQIVGGWISDRIGRIRTVAFGSLAGSIAFLVIVLAPNWQWMLLSTVFSAIGRALVGPSYRAFIAEEADEAHRGKMFGMVDALYQIVSVIGPILGGLLADRLGFHSMLLVAAGLFWLATLLRGWLAIWDNKNHPDSAKADEPVSARDLLRDLKWMIGLMVGGGIVTWLFVFDGIIDTSFTLSDQLIPVYLDEKIGMTKTMIGSTTSVMSLVMIGALIVGGWFADKRSEREGIIVGGALIVTAYAIFLNSQTYAHVMLVWIIFGVSIGFYSPAYDSLVSKVIPENKRGIAFGFFSTSLGVISLPAPYLGSLLWEHVSAKAPFYFPLVATLLVMPIVWFKFRLERTKNAEVEIEVEPAGS